ncbi:MAG: phosphate acyltransferase PlsX [Alphaproteobacteria bacterium]
MATGQAEKLILSLDAMGGDNAPHMVIEGAALAIAQNPDLFLLIYGDESQLNPLLKKFPALTGHYKLIHTPEFIKSDEKPSIALRQGKQSSMRLAIDAVANGEAQGVISAGNTGAYMAMGKFFLKTIPGIDRPAIVASFPTNKKPCVMLDLGANVQCDHNHLVQFALMGNAYAREILNLEHPTVGLLNVGEEEQKGNPAVQMAATILRRAPNTINFHGFIEGDDIAKGTVDVIVTDGFTGNITLKTIEGMVTFMMNLAREAFQTSWLARLGYLFCIPAFKPIKKKMNPKAYNGAMFIGLKGVAIKSHGGADALAFSAAVLTAAKLVSHNFNHQIETNLELLAKDLEDHPDLSESTN